jgi:hypothetical protein
LFLARGSHCLCSALVCLVYCCEYVGGWRERRKWGESGGVDG